MELAQERPTKEPVKVERWIRSKIKIITACEQKRVEIEYDKFINVILSYGAEIKGCKFSTSVGEVDKCPYTEYTVCIFYNLPKNISFEIIASEYK